MTADDEHAPQPLTGAELRARIVGRALARDAEDILFWREASEAVRGRTLYRLRARGKALYRVVPHLIEARDDRQRLLLTPRHAEIIMVDE